MQRLVGFILFSLSFAIAIFAESGPSVTTKCGPIEGNVLKTPKGRCDAYLGIPFARPPTGDLRWKKPQDPSCWTGTFKATKFGPRCIQLGSNGTDPKEDSEDCLYLNVYVPKSDVSTKLPVMVFIHGGGFVLGSGKDYGQEGPCENIALRGVVLVFIQYRLGMYGFFSTGDSTAPGNYAFWDQIQALKWVKENIDSFGGDPGQVTIFGESAGGGSVSYLTYIQLAEDLFQQSIAESGSAWDIWGTLHDASVPTAKKLAIGAYCTDPASKNYVDCLRQLSTAELQQVYKSITTWIDPDNVTQWDFTARVDGELFTQAEFKELKNKKPTIIGVNSMEFPRPHVTDIPSAQKLFTQALDDTFKSGDKTKNKILKQLARYVYVDSKGDRNNDTFVCQQMNRMQADLMFHVGAAQEAESKSKAGIPIWVYNFDFYSDNVFPGDYPFEKGAPHASELCYLFLLFAPSGPGDDLVCPLKYEGKYRVVADRMGEMWTNFAKIGNPSPKGLIWPNFRNVSEASTMTIRADLSIKPDFYLDISNFWNYLKPEIENDF